ncbi:intradiol ring-cleavage dioxygenase [Ktedonospora formicarum]|uniref:Twin-arginine translocation pathway signal protein n=1 Tax=Ktedonospora formicarum TaxID=2778364 RepID=A0A8J3I4J6_9CHLR|nr:intradiol ring-cleavage dioxygenase [Ktedonospora formicarum]GHO47371.1 twin-arginine translocation pathway signal protein [Ktedonospora formicarum]
MDQPDRNNQTDKQTTRSEEDGKDRGLINRRTILSTLGVGVTGLALIGAGGEIVHAASSTVTTTSATTATPACVLASELTEGPYYVALENIRSAITEDRTGIPLELRVTVVDATTCGVIKDAAVDIWHCDALGSYSGEEALGTSGQTYLRGTQLTNGSGVAKFSTIYPGWYTGRAVHIHVKVHIGGSVVDGVYQGGHVSHTGQFFFDEAVTEQVKLLEPYTNNTQSFTTLNQDSIYPKDSTGGALVTLTQKNKNKIEKGFLAEIVVGIDPNATPDPVGVGGGPGGGTPPGDGTPPAGTPPAATLTTGS